MGQLVEVSWHRPLLYPKQEAAIFCQARYGIIEASTKSGKTHGCIVWLLEQAWAGQRGWEYWWVAPIFAQAAIAYRRVKHSLTHGSFNASDSELAITLLNGAVIRFKSADKPDCYDEQTEILTDSGWKRFANLNGAERVLTRRADGYAEWQMPTRSVRYPYDGEMVRLENKRIDLLITPNHRMFVERRMGAHRRGKWERNGPRLGKSSKWIENWTTAEELKSSDRIPGLINWNGDDDPTISVDDCALLGFYLAEGSAIGNSSEDPYRLVKRCGYRIQFSQREGIKGGDKGNVRDEFRAVLRRLGHKVSESRDGLLIWHKQLWSKLIRLGNKYTKFIPANFKNLPPEKLKVLLHWLVMGDGTSRRGCWTYFTVSPQLADDVQEIAIKCGWSATIKERQGKGYSRAIRTKQPAALGYLVKIQRKTSAHFLACSQRSYIRRERYCGQVYCVSVPNKTVLVRRNGKPVWSGNSLYGDDVHAAVVDEASRCKEEAFVAIRSTLTATRGPIRIIGNVRGRKNWAFRMARKAEGGDPDMHYAKLTAWDAVQAGVLHKDEVEDAKRNLPDRAFQELYLAEPADDEGNPFGIEAIRRCIGPLSEAGPDCWGWDLAKSVDWTVGIGLDRQGQVSRFERYQASWQDTIARIRRSTGATQALVDSTGVGDPILEHLQKNTTNFEGLKFTQLTKQQLMEGLAAAIQSQAISFPDGQIVSELEQFGYEYTQTGGCRYSAPEGFHDDCVVALALAVRKRSRPPLQDAVVMLNEYSGLRDF